MYIKMYPLVKHTRINKRKKASTETRWSHYVCPQPILW